MKIKCTQGMSSKSTIKKKKYTEFEITDEIAELIKRSGDTGYVIKFNMFEAIVGYYYQDTGFVINYFHSFQQFNEVRKR